MEYTSSSINIEFLEEYDRTIRQVVKKVIKSIMFIIHHIVNFIIIGV